MKEFLNDPLVGNFIDQFLAGDINLATGILWLGIAIAFSIVGGAIGGIILAGKDLGSQLAAMIGGLFGPAAIIPATVLGLLVLAISNH